MKFLLLFVVSTVAGMAASPRGISYNYRNIPSGYQAVQHVDPVNYIHYSSVPGPYTAAAVAPIQYAATPIVTDNFRFIQYPFTNDRSHSFKSITHDNAIIQYVSPFVKSTDDAIFQYVSPVVKTTDDAIFQYVSPVVKTRQPEFIPAYQNVDGKTHIVQYSAPVVPIGPNVQQRFQSQSNDGSYSFGYSGGPSSRHEIRDKFGIVHGAFNYVDPEGKIQSQQYVADGHGFRVAATNLPVAPKPVEETPEVKAARAAHAAYKAKKN